jgi:4-alpha-glucanotransferase
LEPSPYLPTSRRFANPLYLRVEAVMEYADLPAADRAEIERLRADLATATCDDDGIARDATWTAKRAALGLLHRVARTTERRAVYDAYLARQGRGLVDFATWWVIAEDHGLDRAEWPDGLVDPDEPDVAAYRTTHAARIDFVCWMQWLLDEQLAAAQAAARDAGMTVGIVHDLAVGVHPDGADAWGLGRVLASGIRVGAPPDHFNQSGQNWSQPPWRPDRLAETGYAAYRDLVRTIVRHAGGLRVDHVIGLFRLWWIPEGAPPGEGVYVRYDHGALVGILALETHRAGAVLIGEDLGVVEPWARDYLRDRGVLGTSVLWFEHADSHPLAPERWRELCLATVTTHDLPPTASFLAGEHLDLQARLGLLTRPVDEERAALAAERDAWLTVLRDHGWLGPAADTTATVRALHRAIVTSPARMVALSLTDAVGDRRTQNQPGTTDEYPNWRVPLTDAGGRRLTLADMKASPDVAALAAVMRGE